MFNLKKTADQEAMELRRIIDSSEWAKMMAALKDDNEYIAANHPSYFSPSFDFTDAWASEYFSVCSAKRGEAVGYVHLKYNRSHRSAGLHLAIFPEYRRKGFGAFAIRAAAKYVFEFLSFRSLGASVCSFNEPSLKLVGKFFENTGVLKDQGFLRGAWYDEVIFHMSADQYALKCSQ